MVHLGRGSGGESSLAARAVTAYTRAVVAIAGAHPFHEKRYNLLMIALLLILSIFVLHLLRCHIPGVMLHSPP